MRGLYLGCFMGLAGFALAHASGDDVFPENDLLNDTVMSESACAAKGNAVWIEIAGRGDCIRYYHSNLAGAEGAVAYIRGDRLFKDKPINYTDNAAKAQQAFVEAAASELNYPVIFVARPGTYGSSGDHRRRRELREAQLLDEALRKIQERHHLKQVALAAQSGGASMAAYVVTRRPDIECVALTGASLSMAAIQNAIDDGTALAQYMNPMFYDPVRHVSEIDANERRRIFVIYDKQDRFVPEVNQKAYADAVREAGHQVWLVEGQAVGSANHTLDRTGRHVAAWCARGVPTDVILDRIKRGEITG
ncbi:alpha/beta hydrolase family protein [Rhodoligotrophos defluvii]|uniref:alpha/beta hydrolase family protein n=1 Tax=Rhodoligotrophos defluvii TaxID=2561934 RepID=UPI0010C9C579|nr:hypothetical protein [Rhodoligotrophos defluvii]